MMALKSLQQSMGDVPGIKLNASMLAEPAFAGHSRRSSVIPFNVLTDDYIMRYRR